MSIRLGGILLTPNTIMVLLAGGFFWALAFRRLYPSATSSKKVAAIVLLAASGLGLAFGILYARIASAAGVHDVFDVHLGSLGGYWGAILGAILAARLLHLDLGEVADGLVPGIAAGGIVARIGCMFTGCCRGHVLGSAVLYPWPVYDMAALAVAYWASTTTSHAGRRVATFFLVYGGFRFLLEFARPSAPLCGALSINAAFALFQCLLAGIALGWGNAKR